MRNVNTKTLSISFTASVAAGATSQDFATITYPVAGFNISSIFFDWRCTENVSKANIPFGANITQQVTTNFYFSNSTNLLASPFYNPNPIGNVAYNASTITILTPGQYFFKNFFCPEDITLAYQHVNNAAVQVYYFVSYIIEIDPKYQF